MEWVTGDGCSVKCLFISEREDVRVNREVFVGRGKGSSC